MSTNLDQLASGLASGTVTRRRALAILGASAIGLAFPGIARADDKCPEKCEDHEECEKKSYGKCKKCEKKSEYDKHGMCVKDDHTY